MVLVVNRSDRGAGKAGSRGSSPRRTWAAAGFKSDAAAGSLGTFIAMKDHLDLPALRTEESNIGVVEEEASRREVNSETAEKYNVFHHVKVLCFPGFMPL